MGHICPQTPNLHPSLMLHTVWPASHIYVMCLICLGLKVLATMHINNEGDSGPGEATWMQTPTALDLACKEFTVLLRAYCKWWFQSSRNLLNSSCRSGTEDAKLNKIWPMPKSNLLCWPLLDWSFCFLFPTRVETRNIINFLCSA